MLEVGYKVSNILSKLNCREIFLNDTRLTYKAFSYISITMHCSSLPYTSMYYPLQEVLFSICPKVGVFWEGCILLSSLVLPLAMETRYVLVCEMAALSFCVPVGVLTESNWRVISMLSF